MKFPLAPWAVLAFVSLLGIWSGYAVSSTLSPQEEAVYKQRYSALKNGLMREYAPVEIAEGDGAAALPRARTQSIPTDALDKAEAYAKAANSTAFLVWRGGFLEREAYWDNVRAETPLVSKSLSKPLGAVLIGRALALGHIKSLDQPVSEFIAEWKTTPKAMIRIRHLLDMRSGLLPQGAAPTADHILNRAYLSPRHEDVLVGEYPLVHPPGARFDYSNANAELIAIVIERATGKRFAEFLSEALLKPIGAADVRVWINRPGGLAHAGCCMLAPAETWLRLGILLLQDGRWEGRRLLPEGYVAEMRKGTPQNPNYGLGVYLAEPYTPHRSFSAPDLPGLRVLQSQPYEASDLYMFDGNSNQVVYIVPSRNLVVVRLGETPPAQPEWDNVFLPNLLLKSIPTISVQ